MTDLASELTYIAGTQGPLKQELSPTELIAFWDEFSLRIRQEPELRTQGDAIALMYFLRKANLSRILKQFYSQQTCVKPRGKALHIAPSNVDALFFYSLVLSSLAGNTNAVRLSQKRVHTPSALMKCFIDFLSEAQNQAFAKGCLLFTSAHDEAVNTALSKDCDLRIIWGGDEAVAAFSRLPTKPLCRTLSFPERHSLALIKLHHQSELDSAAKLFITDVLEFSQQGCASPRMILWLDTPEALRSAFWCHVDLLTKETESTPIASMERLVAWQSLKSEKLVSELLQVNSSLSRVQLSVPDERAFRLHTGYGLVLEANVIQSEDVVRWLTPATQTLSYFGVSDDELNQIADLSCVHSRIDRIVPLGESLTFSPLWDGVELLTEFTRKVDIKFSRKM